MIYIGKILTISVIIIQLSSSLTSASPEVSEETSAETLGLVLTWQQDPTSTMTIDWHTYDNDLRSTLEYKKVGASEWLRSSGENFPFPHSDRIIHRVELTGLDAGSEYRFRLGEDSSYRKFRTMPDNANSPIRFIIGGDVRHSQPQMEKTNLEAVKYEPDFIVWGGDLAYADGQADRVDRWYEFMESMKNTLITEEGRVIPVLASIGNHEVLGGSYNNDNHENRESLPPYTQNNEIRELIAPYYFKLFAFPGQPGYGVMDFGNYMSIILLDTDHANPIDGKQTEWLKNVLADRQDVPHIFPNYHVTAYPSVKNMEGSVRTRVREIWVPLFEMYDIRVAFENHDHAYKRTYPIRNGSISHNGVVYIGDGAWGVNTREVGDRHTNHAWYLKRASSQRHFIIGTIHGPHQHFLMVNEDGDIIDEYPRTPHIDVDRSNFAEPWNPPATN